MTSMNDETIFPMEHGHDSDSLLEDWDCISDVSFSSSFCLDACELDMLTPRSQSLSGSIHSDFFVDEDLNHAASTSFSSDVEDTEIQWTNHLEKKKKNTASDKKFNNKKTCTWVQSSSSSSSMVEKDQFNGNEKQYINTVKRVSKERGFNSSSASTCHECKLFEDSKELHSTLNSPPWQQCSKHIKKVSRRPRRVNFAKSFHEPLTPVKNEAPYLHCSSSTPQVHNKFHLVPRVLTKSSTKIHCK